jgi:hypothetical protein
MGGFISNSIRYARSKLSALALGLIAMAFPAAIFLSTGVASAANPSFSLVPFTFDPNNVCPGMTSVWDSSTGNPAPSIFMNKPCTTATVAASGVDIISPLEGQAVSNITELNFDYKTGEHCGAGAPRFNLQLDQAGLVNAFLGCAGGTQSPSANGYTHVEFNATQIAAAVTTAGGTPSSTLNDIYIIFDEGTDTPVGGTVGTPGLVHIDNISVNNSVEGSPTVPTNKNQCRNGGFANFTDNNGNPFKNQGQCIAFVNGKRNFVHITNNNHITITNMNTQTATTGNANSNNNTTGGNATSGNASNSNSTTNNANVNNNPTF